MRLPRRDVIAGAAALMASPAEALAQSAPARPPRGPAAPKPTPTPPPDPIGVVRQPLTRLVSFGGAPFPYDGPTDDGRTRFFDVVDALRRRGRRALNGEVYWEDITYRDDRVLLHVPAGFDPRRPAVIAMFFHGHGSVIDRAVAEAELPRQLAESGANAVLVAPQFAYDAADSSPGKFWQWGAFARFIDEAAAKLARLIVPPRVDTRRIGGVFNAAPVVMVAFSGGYKPAAWALTRGGVAHRVAGLVLLDAVYEDEDKFAAWFAGARGRAFLASFHTESTAGHNAQLRAMLRQRRIEVVDALPAKLPAGLAAIVASGSIERHARFTLEGPPRDPVKTILAAMPGYRMVAPPTPVRTPPAKPSR